MLTIKKITKHFKQLFGVTLLASITLMSCQAVEHQVARRNSETLLTQLPKLKGFDTIKVVPLEFSHTAYGVTCHYIRNYVIIGTPLEELEALDTYAEKLQLLNWIPRERQYTTSKVFYHGENDRLVVESGSPSVDIEDAVDYERLKQIYRSIIFVRIDYMTPTREEC